jgi:hypothetical protein
MMINGCPKPDFVGFSTNIGLKFIQLGYSRMVFFIFWQPLGCDRNLM